MFGIGQPTESELGCLARARTWESLIPWVEEVLAEDEPPPKKKRPKYEYDWRVVAAKGA